MAGQVGFKTEATWGTAVTVDKFMPVVKANPGNGVPERIPRQGISARRIRKPGKIGRVVVNPSVELEVSNKNGIAVLFKHMFGGVSTTGAGPTYTHTYTPASHLGDSFTLQTGITDASDTVRPFTASGCKVRAWDLACAVGGNLMLSLDCTAKDVVTATALATASYSDDEAFTFVEGTVSIGGSSVASARSFTLRMAKNLRDERFVLGSQYTRQQLEDGFFDITGSVEADFDDLTLYASAVAGTTVAVVLTFTSGNGTDTLTITGSGQLTGNPPELSTPGLQSQTVNFEITHATSDASALTAVLVNTESSAA